MDIPWTRARASTRPRRLEHWILLAALAGLAGGCSGGSSGGGPGPGDTVSGVAVDGRVRNGAGTVSSLASGGAATVIGAVSTDAQGAFSFALGGFVGPIRVRLTSGTYTDGADGSTQTLSDTNFLEAVAIATGGPLELHVTPFTTVAARLLDERLAQDPTAVIDAAAVAAVNLAVGAAFGIVDGAGQPVDVTTIRPLDLTDPVDAAAFEQDPAGPEARYGLLVGALAQVAGAGNVPALAQALAQDAADGALDGLDAAGAPVAGVGAGTASAQLAQGVETFLASAGVTQAFDDAALPPPDAANIPSVQTLVAETQQQSGTVPLPPLPGAPTPAAIAIDGLSQGFVNASTDQDALVATVTLPAGALENDILRVRALDAQSASTTQEVALVAGDLTAGEVSFTSLGTAALAEGTLRFTARIVRPAQGQSPTTTSLAVQTSAVKDLTSATVAVVQPAADGAFAGAGGLLLRASASDAGSTVKEVRFEVDGTLVGTVTAPPFQVTFTPTSPTFAEGPAVVTALAFDRAGNAPGMATRAIEIDLTAPAVDASVADGLVSATFDAVSFDLIDTGAGPDVAGSSVTVTRDGQATAFDRAAGSGAITITVPQTDGAYAFTVVARDLAGNEAAPFALTARRDTTPPSGAITAPLAGDVVFDTLTVSVEASDAGGLASVAASLAGIGATVEGTATATGIGPVTVQVPISTASLGDGAATLTVTVTDVAGNFATVNVQVEVGNLAPVFTSAAPTTATEGQAFSYAPTFTGRRPVTLTAPTLPSWLSLSGGSIAGTPAFADVGDHAVVLELTNTVDSVEQSFTITVSPAGTAGVWDVSNWDQATWGN